MDQIIEVIGQEYLIITLLGVIVGYIVTSTPRLLKYKENIPLMNTIIGGLLGVKQGGFMLESIVLGSLAGLVSTGLYELFGKKLKELGKEEVTKDGL